MNSPHADRVLRVTQLVRALSTSAGIYAARARVGVGLPRSDLNALSLLSQAPDVQPHLSAGELGERLGLSPSAVTALLDRLESVGHVRRLRHPDDRRKVVVAVTDSAMEIGRHAFGPLQDAVAAALARFDDADLDAAASVMAALLAAIDAASEELHPSAPQGGRTEGRAGL